MRVEGRSDAVPEPGEDDGGGLAEAGRDIDELRVAGSARVSACQPPLVVVGRVPRCRLENSSNVIICLRLYHMGAGSTNTQALCAAINGQNRPLKHGVTTQEPRVPGKQIVNGFSAR